MCFRSFFQNAGSWLRSRLLLSLFFFTRNVCKEDDFSSLDRTKQCVHTFSADLPPTGGRQTDNRMAWCSYDQCPMVTGLFIFLLLQHIETSLPLEIRRSVNCCPLASWTVLKSASFMNILIYKPKQGKYFGRNIILCGWLEFVLCQPAQSPLSTPQWGAANAEIKVPSGENTELKRSPFKVWSKSVYSHTCYAHCQEFLLRLFLPFRSIHLHFFQNLSRFFPCVGCG